MGLQRKLKSIFTPTSTTLQFVACWVLLNLLSICPTNAGEDLQIPIEKLVIGEDIELEVATETQPIRGVLKSFIEHPKLPSISRLAIVSQSGELFTLQLSSVLHIVGNGSRYRVRYRRRTVAMS